MARRAAKKLRDVSWRGLRIFLGMCELPLDLWEDELRKRAALLVFADVDSSIVGDNGVCAQLFVLDLAGDLAVCGWRLFWGRWVDIGDLCVFVCKPRARRFTLSSISMGTLSSHFVSLTLSA